MLILPIDLLRSLCSFAQMSEDLQKPSFGKQGGANGSYPSEGFYNGDAKKQQTYAFGQALPQQKFPAGTYPEAAPIEQFTEGDPAEGELLYPPPVPGSGEPVNPHLRRFVKRGWKDVWAAVVFLLCAFFVVGVGIANFITFDPSKYPSTSSNSSVIMEESYEGLSSTDTLVLCVGLLLSIFSVFADLFFLIKYPARMIYIANLCSVIMISVYAIMCFVSVSPFLGLLMLCMAGINILWFYYARRRIPFSATIMRTATKVVNHHKSLFASQIVMLGASCTFLFFWMNALIPSMYRADSDATTPWDGFITLFSVFTFFWVMQVMVNVVLVTTCGVVATWYFLGGEDRMPKNATRKSFVRAITTSFGSICFGSLLLASIQFLRWLVQVSRRNNEQNFLTCILNCILAMLQGIVEYVNRYAYVHIAMYGYDYLTAAKHTLELFNQCLVSGLYNDCLVDSTLNLMNLSFSLLVGLFCGLCSFSFAVGANAFLIALVIRSLLLSTISSAVITIFVCYAEVPEALASSDPELYNLFVEGDRGFTNNVVIV